MKAATQVVFPIVSNFRQPHFFGYVLKQSHPRHFCNLFFVQISKIHLLAPTYQILSPASSREDVLKIFLISRSNSYCYFARTHHINEVKIFNFWKKYKKWKCVFKFSFWHFGWICFPQLMIKGRIISSSFLLQEDIKTKSTFSFQHCPN